MMTARDDVVELLAREALVVAAPGKTFTLKSGASATEYVDVRCVSLTTAGLKTICNAFYELGVDIRVRRVAGVIAGGCPLATGFSLKMSHQLDALYVRPDAKGHGTRKKVEGPYAPGEHVVLLEDVVTTGTSTVAAIRSLREVGLVVTDVFAVVVRDNDGAIAIINEVGQSFKSLTTLTELVALRKKLDEARKASRP